VLYWVFTKNRLSESAIEGDLFDLTDVSVNEVPETQYPRNEEPIDAVEDEMLNHGESETSDVSQGDVIDTSIQSYKDYNKENEEPLDTSV